VISYFVSYSHGEGFGCTEVKLRLPVRSMDDIKVFIDVIERLGPRSVVILNFQRFESAAPSAAQPVSAATIPGVPS